MRSGVGESDEVGNETRGKDGEGRGGRSGGAHSDHRLISFRVACEPPREGLACC